MRPCTYYELNGAHYSCLEIGAWSRVDESRVTRIEEMQVVRLPFTVNEALTFSLCRFGTAFLMLLSHSTLMKPEYR